MMKLLKEMYGKNLSDLEFKTLIYMAKKYDLDPVQHEIWAIKYGNAPATIMTGRDGFLAIAHKSGQFDGMETLAITKDGREVPTCLNPKELAGAICRVWRKDMSHPITVAVPLHEYNTGKSNWAKMPETMIQIRHVQFPNLGLFRNFEEDITSDITTRAYFATQRLIVVFFRDSRDVTGGVIVPFRIPNVETIRQRISIYDFGSIINNEYV